MPLCKPPVIIENRSTWHESNINFTYQLCSDLSMSYHGIYILHHGTCIEFKNNFNSKSKNLWLNEVKQIALQSL